mmetsp:Transcript_40853/g.73787  ORF Transcript_40853/g.73787 Transcript_40853/m.73787 type:complete len:243 (+) Transcript_40853:104-832(+)
MAVPRRARGVARLALASVALMAVAPLMRAFTSCNRSPLTGRPLDWQALNGRHVPRRNVACQALQEVGSVKLNLVAGKATPAPPVGPAIGALGCNIAMFVKEYNAMTAGKEGVVPVLVRVMNDRSFTLELKAPPAAELLLKAAGAEKGSATPVREVVGTITLDQLKQVAETKLPEMNIEDITRAMKIVHGTAKSVGVEVEGYDEWLEESAFPAPKNILERYGAGSEMLPKVGEGEKVEEEVAS